MMPFEQGTVVLVRFPFTNLDSAKKRPALVVSPAAYTRRYGDLAVLALTSQPQPEPFLALDHWELAGLLGPTWIKPSLFCIHDSVIDRSIGSLAGDDSVRVSQAVALLIAGEFLPCR
jgi:mRNA interferase MazF